MLQTQNLMMDPRTSAQDVMRCDLCETAVVQMHCDTCLINLCKACVGEHISKGESNVHKVVKFQDRKLTTLYIACTTHDKERCKMYCKQCDIPVCISCISSNQHLGHELSKILQVLDEKKDTFTKERNELNDTVYPTYQDIASDVQNRISQLEKEYGDLSTAISKHGEDWHREIDKLVKKLKAEVDEMKNTQLQTLQKHLDEINKTMSDIKDEINSVEIAIDTNDMSKLFSVTSNVHTYRNLPHKIMPTLPKFIPGKIQGEELSKLYGALSSSSLTSDKHGYSMKTTQKSPEAGSSPPVKQLLDQPETVTTIDNTGYEYLYNVACLSDEEIWTGGNDSTMKLFSINRGSLLKSIRTKSGKIPSNIAVTKSGDLVYTDYWHRTVNIVKNEKIEEVIRLQNWKPKGVCSTSSGDLLVIMDSKDKKQTKVVCYSGSTEKKTIQFDDKGKPLYSFDTTCTYITENKNRDICVSDNAVVVVNQAGKLRFRYTGHTPAPKNEPFNPRGITTDSQSHILRADCNNHCVHIIDQDGQFLCYIDCGLSVPWGLCADANDNLFIAQCHWLKRQVKKIRYLQ
ncbi:tripartite motif-containing protein 2-like [Saccostrea echinata]|uniref:tripartite motif-containing protein 2-like n=1 Tax=Saccostrea echinata TaxID=191078 RepID=UPI002A7F8AF7|nr:tripartite motif-containing protein 2-like [Saccostrea echinata]